MRQRADARSNGLCLGAPPRQKLLCAGAELIDDLADRRDAGDHPDTLARIDRRDSAVVGGDRDSEFGFSIAIFGQRVLMPGPSRGTRRLVHVICVVNIHVNSNAGARLGAAVPI